MPVANSGKSFGLHNFYYKRHFMGHRKNIESKTHSLCRIDFHRRQKPSKREGEEE